MEEAIARYHGIQEKNLLGGGQNHRMHLDEVISTIKMAEAVGATCP